MKNALIRLSLCLLAASAQAATVSRQNISAHNFKLIEKSEALCRAQKETNFYQQMMCATEFQNQWLQAGDMEGTQPYCDKTFKSQSSETLFQLLPNLFNVRNTARHHDEVLAGDREKGELFYEDYTLEITYIIQLLLSRQYQPHWGDKP